MEIVTSSTTEKEDPFQRKAGDPLDFVLADTAMQPAGFIRRFIAYVIDTCILFTLGLLFIFSGITGLRLSTGIDSFYYEGTGSIFLLSVLFIYIGYFTFFHAHDGQTPAKMIMRIKVVTRQGKAPSLFKAFIRTLGFFLSHLFFGFGFLLILIGHKKRALHDLFTGTQVVLSP